ncbi:hypothetical protein EWM64_g5414 [Hericium alpestre]|uniref:Uncharacterized protein n=1 Tax=Hericium alpestre TaxID=135208 RepID=A0A4Y9ZUX8_9AGAM|nr:hypothetical protein EWM64_g5414 [Hericium alpestre]
MLQELETRFIQDVDEAPCLCISEYLDTVSGRLDSQVLTKFKMHVSSGIRRPEGSEKSASYRATPATLQRLLMFDNMQHCNILLQELDCDDDLLASIGLSWPRLRTLSLLSHPLHQGQSHLTLRGLYPLAKGCPQLTYLALNMMRPTEDTLHFEDLAPTWDRSANPFSEPLTMWLGGFKRLAVGKAPEVAGYLKAIFSNVEHVSQNRIDYWINSTTLGRMVQEQDHVRRDSTVLPPDNLYRVMSFFSFCALYILCSAYTLQIGPGPSYLFEDRSEFSDDFGYTDSDVDSDAYMYGPPDNDSDPDF